MVGAERRSQNNGQLNTRGYMERSYRVKWEIDIDAQSPRAAAKKAQEIQLREDSIATVFEVEYHKESRIKSDKKKSSYVRKTIDLMNW